VTYAVDGRLAASKQLVKTGFNARKVEHEVAMAKVVSKLSHPRIAIPFELTGEITQQSVEIGSMLEG
jgi:hypothetical protein